MSNDMTQLQLLDTSLQNVKLHSTHMKTSIEKSDIRQCLKSSSEMINELKTTSLTPSNYYKLYTQISDELHHFHSFIKTESSKGKHRLIELYEAVQQSINILPRLFLMITVGSVFLQTDYIPISDIIYDLLQMLKGIQHPLRGLFTRYYFLKLFKQHLTIEHIIDNLSEMNALWISIQDGSVLNELKVLVGESITTLSAINDLSVCDYKEKVLKQLLRIVKENSNVFSQQYLIECVIHAFNEKYNIGCYKDIVNTVIEIKGDVDIRSIFITIMDRISKYVTESSIVVGNNCNEDINEIFNIMNGYIKNIISGYSKSSADSNSQNDDVMKITELQISLLNFTVKCSYGENKIANVNYIMQSCYEMLSAAKGERKMSKVGITLIMKLLYIAIDSQISIFDMKAFPQLLSFLDHTSSSMLSSQLIESLVNEDNIGTVNSKEKMELILKLIQSIFQEGEGKKVININETLCKLIFLPKSSNPLEQYEMLNILLNTFISNQNHINLHSQTLAVFVNELLMIGHGIANAYMKVESKNMTKYDISSFDNNKQNINQFYMKLYQTIDDILIKMETLLQAKNTFIFKLRLSILVQIFTLNINDNDIINKKEMITNIISTLIKMLEQSDNVKELITILIGCLINIKLFEINDEFNNSIISIINKLSNCYDKCVLMIDLSKIQKTNEKVIECIIQAKKFADYAMINPININLMILLLNEIIRCCILRHNFKDEIDKHIIPDLNEYIKNILINMKNENKHEIILSDSERYYEETLQYIKTNNLNY